MASTHGKGAHFAPAGAPVERIKHPGLSLYFITYGVLLGLLVITYVLYTVDISKAWGWVGWNIVIALIVALIKAVFVVWNFMNVRGGTKLIWLWAAIGFIWLFLMGFIFLDYLFRPTPPGWQPGKH